MSGAGSRTFGVQLTKKEAREIFDAANVCINEGVGSISATLLRKIANSVPSLILDDKVMATLMYMEATSRPPTPEDG